MTEVPKTEDELIEMQKVIDTYEQQLEKLENEVDETGEYIDLMSKYGMRYNKDNVIRFWFLKVRPMEVKKANRIGMSLASKHEKIFLEELARQKSEFEIELKNLEIEFERMRRLKDYTTWKSLDHKYFEMDAGIRG